ncbi:G-type lectin S-receptor-like serine/threonine-protein kinase, partial [Mucuna pruriens]
MMNNSRMLCTWFFLFPCILRTSTSGDTLALNQSIRDGETLISAGGTFEVGFFSLGTSTNRYLGVWYRNLSPLTVVWVANRETPLQNNSGVLKVNEKGVLEVINGTNNSVWSSNRSRKGVNNPIARLLDSGNLVVKIGQDSKKDQFLWQSFDYPCDKLLLGEMKLGWDLITGQEIFLSSWKSADDPAKGEYSLKIHPMGYPQLFKFQGSVKKYRIGSWNGVAFTGFPTHQLTEQHRYKFVLNEKQVYLEFEILDRSIITLYTLTPLGHGQASVWTRQTSTWEVISTGEQDECENYALCGAYSLCSIDGNLPTCQCLKGYVPKFPEQWNITYWSNGCVPRNKSNCKNSKTDRFWRYPDVKLPDTSSSWFSKTTSLEECQKLCLENCSCTAYANLDIRNGGSGCLLWFDELLDTRKFSHRGQDLYIRVPVSELDHVAINGNGNKKKLTGITIGVIIFGLTTCVCIVLHRKRGVARRKTKYKKNCENILKKEDTDLPTFDLLIIAKATKNFSCSNKLGEGGFGPVYKGTLADGQEIAVKRLSKKSEQGLEEFKNEMVLIAKLQHRNLIKLLDETKRKMLDWLKRFNIIDGIARGLLYLHQDSRLRIIHRDLKTSNILLDANLESKISDFGLARILLGDQVEAKTNKVAGTYGYMPPEYAIRGRFSMKSDVFSYGVIVLEIISGKKNREFLDPEHYDHLLGHVWRLWTEGRQLELLDEMLWERCSPSEVIRCIQVALLCVQQKPEDRPDMSSVILMLNGEKSLPKPKVPGFYTKIASEEDALLANCPLFLPNETSITILEAR